MVARASRSCERRVQSDFAVADSPETGQARRTDGVRLGFSGRIVEVGKPVGSRVHRGLNLIQTLRVDQHGELAVEAGSPGRETR
jgi:hypothetical protein